MDDSDFIFWVLVMLLSVIGPHMLFLLPIRQLNICSTYTPEQAERGPDQHQHRRHHRHPQILGAARFPKIHLAVRRARRRRIRIGFPSGVRGTPGVGYDGHCAPSDGASATHTAITQTALNHRVIQDPPAV